MKLTKAKLKQLIKEVVSESFEDGSPETNQEKVDIDWISSLVEEVVAAWRADAGPGAAFGRAHSAAHKQLSNFPESQKLYEDLLKSNLESDLKAWKGDLHKKEN